MLGALAFVACVLSWREARRLWVGLQLVVRRCLWLARVRRHAVCIGGSRLSQGLLVLSKPSIASSCAASPSMRISVALAGVVTTALAETAPTAALPAPAAPSITAPASVTASAPPLARVARLRIAYSFWRRWWRWRELERRHCVVWVKCGTSAA